jgi:hypothetical protein
MGMCSSLIFPCPIASFYSDSKENVPFYIVAGFIRALAVARRSRFIVAVFIRKPALQANG